MKDVSKKINSPTCPSCHTPFDSYYHSPRIVTKCGHTFCQKCIMSRTQSKGNRKLFICIECNSDTTIRRSVTEEFPRNLVILDVVKDIKKQSVTSNTTIHQQPTGLIKNCSTHNKPLQFMCQTCKDQLICSHCAIFGKHKNHSFVDACKNTEKINAKDIQQLKKTYILLSSSVQQSIFPHAPNNILQQSRSALKQGLKKMIKLHFKQYYQPIERRQQMILKQCEEIQIEGGIQKAIDKILNEFQILKIKFENCCQSIQVQQASIADQIIDKAIEMHTNIENLQRFAQEKVSANIHQIAQKVNTMVAFKIQQFPITLKAICNPKNLNNLTSTTSAKELSSAKKRSKSPHLHSNSKQFLQKLKSSNLIRGQPISHQQSFISRDLSKEYQAPKQNILPFTNQNNLLHQIYIQRNIPSKDQVVSEGHSQYGLHKIDKESGNRLGIPLSNQSKLNSRPNTDRQSTPISLNQELENAQARSRVSEKLELNCRTKIRGVKFQQQQQTTPTYKIQKQTQNSKKQLFHLANNQSIEKNELKYSRPMKQIGYELRPKLQQICSEIDRQHQQGNCTSLELISLQINDMLLWYLIEHLRTKKLQFSMMKFVKNNISDEGFRILLSYLAKDNYTKVLNMTGNQISAKALSMIVDFKEHNNILQTIYLSNNKVSAFQIKSKKTEFDKFELEILL